MIALYGKYIQRTQLTEQQKQVKHIIPLLTCGIWSLIWFKRWGFYFNYDMSNLDRKNTVSNLILGSNTYCKYSPYSFMYSQPAKNLSFVKFDNSTELNYKLR